MKRTWIAACAIAAAAVIAPTWAACSRPAAPLAAPRACVVAELGGVTLTDRDVAEVTAAITPAPDPAEANRLLVDATLAHWVVRGFVAGSSVTARLSSYRALSAQLAAAAPKSAVHARALLAVLARAKHELGAQTGPCYAAPSWPVPQVPSIAARELGALRASPAALEKRARAGKRPVVRATLWRLAPRLERIAPGPLFVDELEPALGRALAGQPAGRWLGPVVTGSGLYVARVEGPPPG